MKTEVSDLLLDVAIIKCRKGLDEFRKEHAELIGELLQVGRYSDVTRMFFAQGFLIGMKTSKEQRDILSETFKNK
jgi:hypothetical protein